MNPQDARRPLGRTGSHRRPHDQQADVASGGGNGSPFLGMEPLTHYRPVPDSAALLPTILYRVFCIGDIAESETSLGGDCGALVFAGSRHLFGRITGLVSLNSPFEIIGFALVVAGCIVGALG